MKRGIFGALAACGYVAVGALTLSPSVAAQDNLAAATANPIASLISVPFESTFDFGAENGPAYILNFQPVIPVQVGDWNLISRPIVPIASVGGFTTGLPGAPLDPADAQLVNLPGATGLGDINYSLFLSPAQTGKLIWGVGPSISLPTATDPLLGSEKWSAGPTAVFLTQDETWTFGALIRQTWSFAGASSRGEVNQFLLQPFVNYRLGDGWYLNSAPILTANWTANAGNQWTIPLGGGAGRVFQIGQQPINMRLEAYGNAQAPQNAPDWQTKFTVQLLFPK